MTAHPLRRSTDSYAASWRREESDLVARARGDAELFSILKAAQDSEPADLTEFRQACLRPLMLARQTVGGYSAMDELERALCLAFIDKSIRIVEEFQP